MTQIAWRVAVAAAAAVLLLAGCGPGADEAACKTAMKQALARATADGAKAGRPPQCAGISDARLQELAKQVIGEAVQKALTTTTSEEALTTTSDAPSDTTTESEVVHMKLGEQASVVDGDGESSGTITISAARTYRKPTSEFGQKPKNGRYLRVTVSAQGSSGQFSVNPYDFYATDPDGDRFQVSDGNAILEAGDGDLNDAQLNPGEKVRGTMTFDLPSKAKTLVYAPAEEAQATWALP